jgi:hypothetical protein
MLQTYQIKVLYFARKANNWLSALETDFFNFFSAFYLRIIGFYVPFNAIHSAIVEPIVLVTPINKS